MVRIVSGIPENEQDTGAVLRGFTNARKLRAEAEAERRRQMGAMAEIQRTKMKLDAEKAKALADANARAQMGDVQAMRQQDMERAAQGLPPEMKRLGEYAELRKNTPDPKAQALLDKTFLGLEEQIQTEKKKAALDEGIQNAVKDGLLDDAGAQKFRLRQQSGEPPDNLLKELSDAADKRDALAVNMADAAEWIQKAQARIQAAPPGRERKLAQMELQRLAGSRSKQEKPNSGAEMNARVEEILIGSQSRFPELQKERLAAFRAQPAPGLPGMTVEQRNKEMMQEPSGPGFTQGFGLWGDKPAWGSAPDVPEFQASGSQAHATRKRPGGDMSGTPKAKVNLPTAKLKKAKSEDDVVDALIEAGVPVTQQNIIAAEEVWRSGG